MRICFVTNELHPVAPGGIGRLMYNFAVDNAAKHYGAELHYLFPGSERRRRALLQAALEGLGRVHFCGDRGPPTDPLARAIKFVRKDDWNFEQSYSAALEYHFGLIQVQRDLGIEFDVVEFPDYGGWAFAALQAKLAGLDFSATRIAVRLHSTLGMICRYERFYHQPSEYFSAVFDQERYCLQHADIVVAHLPCIADLNAAHYRFDDAWRQRVRIEFPPIVLDEPPATDSVLPSVGNPVPPTFVFSSRLQPFKRPDIFINAGVRFIRLNPSLEANFLLISYGWDNDYIAYLEELIPEQMKHRIAIKQGISGAERQAILKTAIVVVPSDYESLCLFAYEAALLGRRVILNRDCDAFGRCDRWRDGENCLLFADDFVGLAEALLAALSWTPARAVNAEAEVPYWADETLKVGMRSATEPPSAPVSAHIVAFSDGQGGALAELCFRLSRAVTEGAKVTVMLPDTPLARTAELSALLAGLGWRLGSHSGTRIRPAEVQRLLETIPEDVLVLVPQDVELNPNFMSVGLRCLERNPQLAIFSTHVGLANETGAIGGVALFPGQLPSVTLQRAAVPEACMLRRSALGAHRFDERARERWLDTFCREVVLQGGEVIVAPIAALTALRPATHARSNKLIDATLRDETCLRAGVVPRLLSLVAVPGVDNWQDNPNQMLAGAELARMTRVWPPEVNVGWEPVHFKNEVGSVLLHPLPTGIVVGHLRLVFKTRPRRVECVMRNGHANNLGFEAMGILTKEPLSAEALSAVEQADQPEDWSDWHFLAAQTTQTITLAAATFGRGEIHLYLATRIRTGTNNDYAWAELDSVKIF